MCGCSGGLKRKKQERKEEAEDVINVSVRRPSRPPPGSRRCSSGPIIHEGEKVFCKTPVGLFRRQGEKGGSLARVGGRQRR